jgi:hypothetical protein
MIFGQKGSSHMSLVDGDLDGIMIDLESYLLRRMVCDLGTKNYSRFFLSMLQKLSGSSERISREAIQQMLFAPGGSAGEWPDDKKFAKAWLEKTHYEALKPMRCSMLLEALDRAMITPKQEALVTYGKLQSSTYSHSIELRQRGLTRLRILQATTRLPSSDVGACCTRSATSRS